MEQSSYAIAASMFPGQRIMKIHDTYEVAVAYMSSVLKCISYFIATHI